MTWINMRFIHSAVVPGLIRKDPSPQTMCATFQQKKQLMPFVTGSYHTVQTQHWSFMNRTVNVAHSLWSTQIRFQSINKMRTSVSFSLTHMHAHNTKKMWQLVQQAEWPTWCTYLPLWLNRFWCGVEWSVESLSFKCNVAVSVSACHVWHVCVCSLQSCVSEN